MLFSLLRSGGSFSEKLLVLLVWAFCILLSLTVHELSHGLAAYWMGDKTAKYSGRLSLNPMHHLEPIGAACLFLFGFGWAKPVPVNPWNFRHKKGGMAITALAGPIANFLLAFLAQLGMILLGGLSFSSVWVYRIAAVAYIVCDYLTLVNLGLGIFNLIPVPPLDGSKILGAVIPNRCYRWYMNLERYGFIVLIVVINLPFFNNFLYFCENGILDFFKFVIGLIL